MASSASYTVGDTTPVLIFSGTGNVAIRPDSTIYVGGSNVSASSGYILATGSLVLNVNSPDEIYALATTGATRTVTVLSVR